MPQRYRLITDPATGVWLQGYGVPCIHPTGEDKLTYESVSRALARVTSGEPLGGLEAEPLAIPDTHCPRCQRPGLFREDADDGFVISACGKCLYIDVN